MEDAPEVFEDAQLTGKEGASNTAEEGDETQEVVAPMQQQQQTVGVDTGQEEAPASPATSPPPSPLVCRKSIPADGTLPPPSASLPLYLIEGAACAGERDDDDDDDASALELMLQPASAPSPESTCEREPDGDTFSAKEPDEGTAEAEAKAEAEAEAAAAAPPPPAEVLVIEDDDCLFYFTEIILDDDEEKLIEVIAIDDDDDHNKEKSGSAAAATEQQQQNESAMELETNQDVATSKQTAECDPDAEVQVKQESKDNEGLLRPAVSAKVEHKEEQHEQEVEEPGT
jgi:hypothetical protein